MNFYNRNNRYFRGRKTKVNNKYIVHPIYIIGENNKNLLGIGITHSSKKGKHHNNHRLLHNPDKNDSRPAYMKKKSKK